jgi:tRNA threonylcarbamoyladenosine biosynthesis protein TsaE
MKASRTIDVTELSKLQAAAEELSKDLQRPCLLLLHGDLGSGKTTLVQALVKALGGTAARSPTYALHQTYETPQGQVDHLDLYRLKEEAELYTVGWQDILQDKTALVCVEWPKLVESVGFSPQWKVWNLRLWQDETNRRWLQIS